MTKRIIALALVAVFACFALASCTETTPATTTPATKEPATTAPAGTTTAPATTPADPTVVPGTTPADPTVVPGTTPADEPTDYDMFEQWGGIDKMFFTTSVYGKGFEVWPFNDNGSWCARAFFQATITLGEADGIYTQNVGTDDYEYTWKWFYHDAEVVIDSKEAFDANVKGPFTTPIETFYDFGNGNVIYRPIVGSAPEGDMCGQLEAGKAYFFVIAIYKGEDCVGFAYPSISWTEELDAAHEVYTNFWSTRDRADGYASGMQTLTDADIQFALSKGFDENGTYTGVAA